ncbi:MAG: proprotein convertase P-domain-containing protein, partial [Dokdonella sp.]
MNRFNLQPIDTTRSPFPTFAQALAIALLTLLCGMQSASADVDKGASYQEMLALTQQLAVLKPRAPGNPSAALQYETAANRYLELALAMGGDDPGQVLHPAIPAEAHPSAPKPYGALPLGCSTATTNFSDETTVTIPTGPGVVTSSIVVSGASTYLLDLNVTTQLQHTFSADLDVTLTSPAGTVVTLTTDNGGSNDDVFNGTLWDDSANPAGQVPYTTNDGLVTDQLYANLVTATPLVPEEALGAFIGEDPNGTWTLTISDDLAGDGGSLNGWSMDVTTLPESPITTIVPTQTQPTPVAIPTGPAVVTSTIVVSGAGSALLDVNATTFIQHTFSADLDVTLTSPAGTVVTLTTDNGGSNDDVFNGTVWDDSANPAGQVPYTLNDGLVTDQTYANLTLASPLVPEEAMAAFIGEDPNGTWTLTVSDDLAGDGGSLNSWSLDIKTFTCSSADLAITKTDGVTTAAPGGSVTYTITASNAGPGGTTGTVADTFPAALTCTWTCVGAAGGTCTASGAGNISDPVTLPSGGSVTYTASCTISASATGSLVNTATVAGVAGDPTPANNTATDTD